MRDGALAGEKGDAFNAGVKLASAWFVRKRLPSSTRTSIIRQCCHVILNQYCLGGSVSRFSREISRANILEARSVVMSSSSSPQGVPRKRRGAHRSNVARACDRCRYRKVKCTGEEPSCALCRRLHVACAYSSEIDRRMTDRTAQEEIVALRKRVKTLEQQLRQESEQGDDTMNTVNDNDPFETGRLVLASNGNLHLYPSATFYRPAVVISEWHQFFQSISSRPGIFPAYLATYLPIPMAEQHHRMLVDLAFDCLLCFGPIPFATKFISAMNTDPYAKSFYFSPVLHLCILGIGWRYCRDPLMLDMYYPGAERTDLGAKYITQAREMLLVEADAPHLSTILALFIMALYNVGMLRDSVAGVLFMAGQYLCMDFRLNKRCDAQLGELREHVGSDLDVARRNVWGFALNLSAWWSTFYAQPSLPLVESATQRAPLAIDDEPDLNMRLVSFLAARHPELSRHGLAAWHCNHLLHAPMAERIERVADIRDALVAWRASLPAEVTWPPSPDGPVMHPGNIVTHGMYATYMILLSRPYMIEHGGSRRTMPDALQCCLAAAREIVDQCRYLVKHHGVHRAPLSWQHTVYVCGTTLVLQASGLPGVPAEQADFANESLRFLQDILTEFSDVWPAAAQTSDSLRQLHQECSPKDPDAVADAFLDPVFGALAAWPPV